MALIACPECGKSVSDTIEACIHCGYNLYATTVKQINPLHDRKRLYWEAQKQKDNAYSASEYKAAACQFNALGDYLDSVVLAHECELAFLALEPVKMMDSGEKKHTANCGAKVHLIEDIETESPASGSTTEDITPVETQMDHIIEQEVKTEEAASNIYSIPQSMKSGSSFIDSQPMGDKIKTKALEKWNSFDLFYKIVTVGMGISILLLLIALLSHKVLPIFISILQIGGLVAATLMHKEIIKSPKRWLKYLVLVVAILFVVLNLLIFSAGKSKSTTTPSTEKPTQTTQIPQTTETLEKEETETAEVLETEEAVVETNYTITKGSQYAFMSDEWNVYIATAISDSILKVEHWDKTMKTTKKMAFNAELGNYKINDPQNGFEWLDDEHTAFSFIFKDKNNSHVETAAPHIFTININDSDLNKGTNYDNNIACYSYTNDGWHMYRAIPMTDSLIKIECWARGMSVGDHLYGWDWCVIELNNTDTDFAWTDDEHTSFSITARDPENDSYWKTDTFVVFALENENYKYPNVITYLGLQSVSEDEAKVPDSASGYKYDNYKNVQESLSEAGFTNIKTEILYDIVLGWTSEGEVDSVSIAGDTSFDKGTVFRKEAEVIITYHMKEEEDPSVKNLIAQQLEQQQAQAAEEKRKAAEAAAAAEKAAATMRALEERLPQEMAKRAAVVAITNYCGAIDVFMPDGNTLDVTKFHSYADMSGNFFDYYIGVNDWGEWIAKDENTWHAEQLRYVNCYGNELRAEFSVRYDGENYLVSNVVTAFGDLSDPSKSGATEYSKELVVAPKLIQDDREQTRLDSYYSWVSNQFSSWDGSHREFAALIKNNLNDEKSFKHIETTYAMIYSEDKITEVNKVLKSAKKSERVKIGDLFVSTRFSAKNAFNATIENTAFGIVSFANNSITLIAIQ